MPVGGQAAKAGSQSADRSTGEGSARRIERDTSRDAVRSTSKPADPSPTDVHTATIVTGHARCADAGSVKKIVWCELLAYANFYRHCSNEESLCKVIVAHFSAEHIADAKRLLVSELQSVTGVNQYVTERRNSTARPAHEAEVEDIVGILDAADLKQALDGYLFVASNFQAVPKFGPEEINLAVVVDRQVHMEASISSLSASVQQIAATSTNPVSTEDFKQATQKLTLDLEQQLVEIKNSVDARLEHINVVCVQLAENAAAAAVTSGRNSDVAPVPRAGRQSRDVEDRSMNLVVFGVAENRDATIWRQKIDQALQFVAGNNVDTADMFRIGRFVDGKVRPVVVKLRTAWDKRIILSKCNKLKGYSERIFISADEPLPERRKRMLGRIKRRAERDRKSVAVVDGVLMVNDIPVFSLKDGKLHNND